MFCVCVYFLEPWKLFMSFRYASGFSSIYRANFIKKNPNKKVGLVGVFAVAWLDLYVFDLPLLYPFRTRDCIRRACVCESVGLFL